MNVYTKLTATEIQYIVKLLELNIQSVEDVISNIDSIKSLASSILDKCEDIKNEMYSLAE
jgi:hypothetical protein